MTSNQELVAEYGRLEKLLVGQGDQPGRMTTLGWDLEYLSLGSVLGFIDYILFRRMNDFVADRDRPVILDCGANVGFTVLNYKRRYPHARITAFEPDPQFVSLLQRNLARNGASDVDIVESAVWTSRGRMPWTSVGTDGSRVVAESSMPAASNVATIDLLDYLDQDVDLLKVDIEGAEFDVVPHLAPRLLNVRNILVECHLAHQCSYQSFGQVIATLQAAGFQIGINSYGPWRDLTRRHVPAAYHAEQYVLVAGWRSDHGEVSREPTFVPYAGIRADVSIATLRDARDRQNETLVDLATGRSPLDVLTLEGPFRRELGDCWMIGVPDTVTTGDSIASQESATVVLEDETVLGPAHTVHDEIRAIGRGRYSHWGSQLYFSTSDNSNPNTNGRAYRVVCRRQ